MQLGRKIFLTVDLFDPAKYNRGILMMGEKRMAKLRKMVGSADHPMVDGHYIQWIVLETENGSQRRVLKPGDSPSVTFALGSEKAVAVYAYCNLHGLWKTGV